MMARQNVRLPILTIERVAPFFCVTDVVAWVSLGLRVAGDLTTSQWWEERCASDRL